MARILTSHSLAFRADKAMPGVSVGSVILRGVRTLMVKAHMAPLEVLLTCVRRCGARRDDRIAHHFRLGLSELVSTNTEGVLWRRWTTPSE